MSDFEFELWFWVFINRLASFPEDMPGESEDEKFWRREREFLEAAWTPIFGRGTQ